MLEYLEGFFKLSSSSDLKLGTNSSEGNIVLNSLNNVSINSDNDINIKGKNIELISQTDDNNNLSFISDNINSTSNQMVIKTEDYNNTVNNNYVLSSSNVNIIASNDICIAAYSTSLDIDNTPRIDIGTHSGIKLINDNIVFGEKI